MSKTKVVTYSTPLPGVELDLCAQCAELDHPLGYSLGQVQHGAHWGVCQCCEVVAKGEEACQ